MPGSKARGPSSSGNRIDYEIPLARGIVGNLLLLSIFANSIYEWQASLRGAIRRTPLLSPKRKSETPQSCTWWRAQKNPFSDSSETRRLCRGPPVLQQHGLRIGKFFVDWFMARLHRVIILITFFWRPHCPNCSREGSTRFRF